MTTVTDFSISPHNPTTTTNEIVKYDSDRHLTYDEATQAVYLHSGELKILLAKTDSIKNLVAALNHCEQKLAKRPAVTFRQQTIRGDNYQDRPCESFHDK